MGVPATSVGEKAYPWRLVRRSERDNRFTAPSRLPQTSKAISRCKGASPRKCLLARFDGRVSGQSVWYAMPMTLSTIKAALTYGLSMAIGAGWQQGTSDDIVKVISNWDK